MYKSLIMSINISNLFILKSHNMEEKSVKNIKKVSMLEEAYKRRLKFSWLEMFSNPDGKTSGSAFVGVIVSLACLAIFISLMVFYFLNPGESTIVLQFIDRLTIYFGIASGLLGLKSLGVFSKNGRSLNVNAQPQLEENSDDSKEEKVEQ